jgi:hypothetical protein
MELPYLFALGGFELPLAPEQERRAEHMVDYWTAFAHSVIRTGRGARSGLRCRVEWWGHRLLRPAGAASVR